MNKEAMEIPSEMIRLVRLVKGEALVEEEDPKMVAEVDMGIETKAHTLVI